MVVKAKVLAQPAHVYHWATVRGMAMRRTIMLCVLALGALAARSPAPTDPVAVYVDNVQNLATEAAATVQVTGPAEIHTGKTFWVGVEVDIGNSAATVLNISGNLYYDSTLVRPTGRILNPSLEPIVSSFTNGDTLTGECSEGAANYAAVSGISWKRVEGIGNYDAWHPKFEIEFLPFAAGTVTFSWTDAFTGCDETTVADGDFDRKPSGVIWEIAGSYYTATAGDGGSYATSDLVTVISGDTKDNSSFWRANPESLETYIDFGPTIQAADNDVITIPVSIWAPVALAEGDSIGFTFVWETQELNLTGVGGSSDSKWQTQEFDPNNGLYYWNLTTIDSTFTSICGLDSAGAYTVWVRSANGKSTLPDGEVVNLSFVVLRDGNATVKLGCLIEDVEEIGLSGEAFPSFTLDRIYRHREKPGHAMLRETPQQTWKWRYGSRSSVVVQ